MAPSLKIVSSEEQESKKEEVKKAKKQYGVRHLLLGLVILFLLPIVATFLPEDINHTNQINPEIKTEIDSSLQNQDKIVSQNKVKKAIFPVKDLINKTPTEIEEATEQKLTSYSKKPSGKLMEAGLDIGNASIWTVYALVENSKVKYNGTILFQIFFNNPLTESEAWNFVGFTPPNKNKAAVNSSGRTMWKNINGTEPFYIVDVWYSNNKVESLKFYLLSDDEENKLYN